MVIRVCGKHGTGNITDTEVDGFKPDHSAIRTSLIPLIPVYKNFKARVSCNFNLGVCHTLSNNRTIGKAKDAVIMAHGDVWHGIMIKSAYYR